MADTKISDLPTDITTLADGDKFPVADASALTTDTYATALEIKTYANTAPNFAAGSATAGSWPQIVSGTVQTTPDAGTFPEYDGNAFYATSDAGNRGYLPVRNLIRQDTSRTLTSTTTEQQLFNGSTNGRLTLETGLYFFRCQYYISGLSATSGNLAFDILGAGSATVGTVLYHVVGVDGNSNTAATQTGSTSTNAQSSASAVTAGTGTATAQHITGTFEVTSAGTIQPAVTLVTAAAGTVAAGSYFFCERAGNTAVSFIGQWD